MRAACALVVGVGGLGCPASLYLAASGVGKLVIADPDKVDLTNLQRQILFGTDAVGAHKVYAASASLKAINPEVEIVPLAQRLEDAALDALVQASDVVLDCTDNFKTRQALNRTCVRQRKPLVSGAAIQFDAQITVFDLRLASAPCYACLFPEDARVDEVQCSQMGVFAPLTGAVGALQAMEAVKLIAAAGGSLNGRLLLLDARIPEWRSVGVPKDPACLVCGSGATSTA